MARLNWYGDRDGCCALSAGLALFCWREPGGAWSFQAQDDGGRVLAAYQGCRDLDEASACAACWAEGHAAGLRARAARRARKGAAT